MTRKDSEKDAERPHYYSQFWLDVAAGRRVIGMPKPNEDAELAEPELPEPVTPRKTARNSELSTVSDGRADASARPVAEPVAAPKEFIEPDESAQTSENEEPEAEEPEVEDKDIPDVDLDSTDDELDYEETEEEEEKDEFFDEEEEEDIGWGSRGRKKPKPSRVVKQPPKKPVKRDRRPGY